MDLLKEALGPGGITVQLAPGASVRALSLDDAVGLKARAWHDRFVIRDIIDLHAVADAYSHVDIENLARRHDPDLDLGAILDHLAGVSVFPDGGRAGRCGRGRCRWCGCRGPCRGFCCRRRRDRLAGALRTHRDRAMVLAMLLAGLRRCEVLGLRFEDVQVADRRLAVVEGKGGHHRVVPAANRFFDALGAYLHDERPAAAATDRVFVVLKGPRRGMALSAEGLDEILDAARRRAGLVHATCHELRHTCLTRLGEAGMALEAVQAQAGHRSIESTRVCLHLANDWLAGEYRRAAALIDADTAAVAQMLAAQEVAR